MYYRLLSILLNLDALLKLYNLGLKAAVVRRGGGATILKRLGFNVASKMVRFKI